MKKRIVGGSLVFLGLFSMAGWAQGPGGWGGGGMPGRGMRAPGDRLMALLDNDRVKAALNLTDQQVDRLRQIAVDTEKASVKNRADAAVRGIELRELLRADKPDRDAVMKKVQEVSSLRAEMMKEHIDALLAAKDVLTPEQQKKIRTFIESRRGFGAEQGRGFEFRGRVPAPPGRPAQPPAHPGEPPVQ